jgi:WD40 repeat protein
MDVERRVPHRISSGLQAYTSLDASDDRLLLVATESKTTSELWSLQITDGEVGVSGVSRVGLPTTYGASPRVGPGFFTYRAPGAWRDGIWKTADNGEPVELWSGLDGRPVSGAAVSKDGKRVAFVVRRDGKSRLWIVNADGSGPRHISGVYDILGAPAWSPSGEFVAAAAMSDGQPKLFLFPVDDRNQLKLLVDDYAVDPAWSPSGEYLVYTDADVGTNFYVKAVNADGTPKAISFKLTRGARRLAFLSEHELVFLQGNISYRDFYLMDLRNPSMPARRLSNLVPDFEIQDFAIDAARRLIIFDRRQEESNIVLIDRRVK